MTDCILVLDFGGQYCHLIARRIRALSVYTEILPFDVNLKQIIRMNPKGIILSGGPSSVYDRRSPKLGKEFLNWLNSARIPILGLCYGHQLLAYSLNGRVEEKELKEYGKKELYIRKNGKLLHGLNKKEIVWMSHGDQVIRPPENCRVLASTDECSVAAYEGRNIYGLQFHPEVRHTPKGIEILKNFVFNICKCSADWKMGDFIEKAISKVREQVGNERVIMGMSGGVDSSVAAVLIHRAINDNLHCIFVNNGLLRKNEPKSVINAFEKHLGFKNFHYVNAEEKFLSKLKGITDPEEKRRIIANLFIGVFEEKAEELEEKYGKIKFLGQGTIFPDKVESAATSKSAARIKSHHNVVLPRGMKLELIEPLADLYKDEVRVVGKRLGLPDEIIKRQPFPGPGLAVRCLGEITGDKLRILREADAIVEEEIRKAGLYEKIWQSFAVFLPIKAVGVMGDSRTYEYVIAIRAVESIDVMTADWAKLPYEVLEKISNRIVNEVKGVNRVVYDVTSKPPGTVEWE